MGKVHPMFHEEQPPIVINEEEEWELDRIIKSSWILRSQPKKPQWYVAWKGFDTDHYCQVKLHDMTNALEMIQDFQHDHPDAPRIPADQLEEKIQEGEAIRIAEGYYKNPHVYNN
ncbi:hypothetical protein PQX77_019428 [Marasmius sp. AFHP31]|nr:hypothetical protein PQX77_019428 [Marasmius sp. AFHP31]